MGQHQGKVDRECLAWGEESNTEIVKGADVVSRKS